MTKKYILNNKNTIIKHNYSFIRWNNLMKMHTWTKHNKKKKKENEQMNEQDNHILPDFTKDHGD